MEINLFDDLIDEREPLKVVHELPDILFLSLCAVLCGAENYEEIVVYGREKESFLRQFVKLSAGIPSVSTIQRTFRHLDPCSFGACLTKQAAQIVSLQAQCLVNIDGKVLRGTAPKGKKNGGICILSAWAQEQNLVLGQLKVEEKSNEKTAIPELLDLLDLDNALVSIDAVACDAHIPRKIVERGGDYIIGVKQNKKGLYEEVSDWLARKNPTFDVYHKTDAVGGRMEQHCYTVCTNLAYLNQPDLLANSQSIIKVDSTRTVSGEVRTESRYYISSIQASASTFAKHIRGHWSIENQLHWHLDVSFNEDKCRVRKDNGAQNMNTMRKLALQGLQTIKDKNSIKRRRLKAGWNDDFLTLILQTAFS